MTNIPRIQTREITAAVVRKKGGPFRVETLVEALNQAKARDGA